MTTRSAKQKEICSICGLLGAHKPHKILLKKELNETIARSLKDIRMQFGLIPSRGDFLGAVNLGTLFEARAKTQMDRCKKVLESKYKVDSKGH